MSGPVNSAKGVINAPVETKGSCQAFSAGHIRILLTPAQSKISSHTETPSFRIQTHSHSYV